MDGGAVVTMSAGGDTVPVEWAVFTSIRSPMGEGYRIIAASPGVTRDEKREIVQCAPSHGSLCDSSPEATGLASFTMSGGRHCLLLSRHAGIEQSARGGYRVLTHVLLLEPGLFARFSWNPFEVEGAALAEVGVRLPETPPARLEPLSLRCRSRPSAEYPDRAEIRASSDDVDRLAQTVSTLLERHPTLIVGAPVPRDALRWTLQATPGARRQNLSVSYGLKFSPTRRFEFILADATSPEIERIVRDHQYSVMKWETPPTSLNGPFHAWLHFVRQRWEAGRFDDVARLSVEITQDCSADSLARVVRLTEDIERVAVADAALLDELTQRHLSATPTGRVPRRLLDELRMAVASRRAELVEVEQESAAQAAESAREQA
jgi:hypothetical protein